MNFNIKVKKVLEQDLKSISNIVNEQLGLNYINSKNFMQNNFQKYQASLNNELVGFITFKYVTVEDVLKRIPKVSQKKLEKLLLGKKITYIGTVATDSEYKRLGVATVLFKYVINLLEKDNVIIMTGWKNNDTINIGGIANQYGFENILEIKDFWKADSIKKKYDCHICGNPCFCSAIIYMKYL